METQIQSTLLTVILIVFFHALFAIAYFITPRP